MKRKRQERTINIRRDTGIRALADSWEYAPRKTPGVYAVLNWANGRCYVGSATDLRTRMTQHRSAIEAGRHDNRLLCRDVKRFGAASFSIFPIETVSISEAKLSFRLGLLEYEWTLRLGAHVESTGYNCQLGKDWTKATRFRDHERKRIRWGSYSLLEGMDLYDPINEDLLHSWAPSFVRPPWSDEIVR